MNKERGRLLAPLAILLVLTVVMLAPKYIEDKAADTFAAPLFDHDLPANTEIIQKDTAQMEGGGMMAAMLLKTELTSEELEAFYADVQAQPAQQGDQVTLAAKALNESSIEALKQAKLYEEGASYQFVYLTSASAGET